MIILFIIEGEREKEREKKKKNNTILIFDSLFERVSFPFFFDYFFFLGPREREREREREVYFLYDGVQTLKKVCV